MLLVFVLNGVGRRVLELRSVSRPFQEGETVMRKGPFVVATLCLIGAFSAGEAMAQRGGRAVSRVRGGIPSAGSLRPSTAIARPGVAAPAVRLPAVSGATIRPSVRPYGAGNLGTLQGHLGVRP